MWRGLNPTKMAITFKKAHWMPIIVFVWFPLSFLITYIVAVSSKKVTALWPYISDTGTFPPEACIFGQLLNTGSILLAMVIYLRYRHVSEMLLTQTAIHGRKLNSWSLWIGLASSFGISVVGNFQETNIFEVHMIGAVLAFGGGTIYQILQSIISWRLYPLMGSKQINVIRICMAAICLICLNLTLAFAATSMVKFDGEDITKWTSEHKGYVEHLYSTTTEWILACCTMAFVLTLTNELRYVKVVEPEIQLKKMESNITEVQRF